MNIVESFKTYYVELFTKNFANFKGRAGMKEFWYFVLFNFIITTIVGILDSALGLKSILTAIYGLAILIPSLGLGARRLHDIGKSGWFMLVSLIPLIGVIWLIILFCKKSGPDNEYGPAPAAEVKA